MKRHIPGPTTKTARVSVSKAAKGTPVARGHHGIKKAPITAADVKHDRKLLFWGIGIFVLLLIVVAI